jgi:L-ribulose-5-phosphate 3-epimerase
MQIGTFEYHFHELCKQHNISLSEGAKILKNLGIENLCIGLDDVSDPIAKKDELLSLGLQPSDAFGNLRFLSDCNIDNSMINLLKKASELNVDRLLITIEGYRNKENDKMVSEDLGKTIVGFNKVTEKAKNYNIKICIEDFDVNIGPTTFYKSISYLLNNVPDLGYAYDSGNYIYSGEDELTALKSLCSRISCVHLKDRSFKPILPGDINSSFVNMQGKVFYPSPVGSGIIHIKEILEILSSINYQGPFYFEHFGASDQLLYLQKSSDNFRTLTANL